MKAVELKQLYPVLLIPLLSVMLGAGVVYGETKAKKPLTLDQRMDRIERQMRNQSLTDVVIQLQQLQQEVQQLRGEVELQKHTIDAMNSRQRDLYLDIDQRLSRMQGGAPAAGVDSGVPVVPVPAAVAPPAPLTPPAVNAPQTASVEVTPPDPKKEAAAYQKAFNLLKQGRYKESIASFNYFLKHYPGGVYEDNAQYWLGEASYVSRDFDTALVEFSKVIDKFPQSGKTPGAMLKRGYIYYEKKDWDQAREQFTQVIASYPGGTEARLADKRLERMDKEGR